MDYVHVVLTKVASITGHRQITSLLPYIDLAFQEMGIWDTSEQVLELRSKAEAAYRKIQILMHDVGEGRINGMELLDIVSETLENTINGLNESHANDKRMLEV